MTCPNIRLHFYSTAATDTLATIQPLHTDGRQNRPRRQAKTTMCGDNSNQDLMTEDIHYNTQTQASAFGSTLIWYGGDETVTHQLCGVNASLLTYVQFSTFAFLFHPDLLKPQSPMPLFHHCVVTRSKQRIIPTSSSEMFPSLITCCTGADNEEHMFGSCECG